MKSFQWIKDSFEQKKALRSSEKMELYRNSLVRRLVAHAYRNVPYYRRLFDQSGIVPGDIRAVEDLARVPVSTKNDMRKHADDTLSTLESPRRLLTRYTTGSSGEPFHIRLSIWEAGLSLRHGRRRMAEYGSPRGDLTAVLTLHADSDSKSRMADLAKPVLNWYAGRRVHLSCREDPERLLKRLQTLQPDVVLGYSGILAELGELLRGRRETEWRPRYLLSGSETLTPLRRRSIEEGFGARVYDFYAARETGMIAWECPSTGLYHVADDNIIINLEQDGKPVPSEDGVQGETIVTNLHAYAMPFIRYRLNDAVVKGPPSCPCGSPFSTLRVVLGRRMDYFTLHDGRRVHPLGIARSFIEECPFIRQYQIVQETHDRIALRAVIAPSTPESRLREIPERIREYLEAEVEVRIDVLDRIPPEPSGKHRLFASHVSDNDPDWTYETDHHRGRLNGE